METDWVAPALRGALGLLAFSVVYLAARYRWKEREPDHGAADVGLD